MKVAIPSTNGIVGGPGGAREVHVYDLGSEARFVEKYENPAITAQASPGIMMLRSVLEHGAECMIVSGCGEHVFNAARGKVKIYQAEGISVEEAAALLLEEKLSELTAPNHGHHGNHEHHDHHEDHCHNCHGHE